MRLLILVVALTVAINGIFVTQSGAVGLYAVGKEQISCSPLVARGVVPDTWNKLSEALLVPQISWALDRLAVEMKTVLSQFGAPPSNGVADTASLTKEEILPVNDKEKVKEVLEEKPAKKTKKVEVKKDKKVKKTSDKPKKRIKVPPKAM
ncbi:MAG: hypothetical protein PHS86_10300 [Syntrophaceae bacterium]|nr:hypothetical protein [Syntrophaceae bacterium]